MSRFGRRPSALEQERQLRELGLPLGWRHPVTGRRALEWDPRLLLLGSYVRRSRYLVGMSQQALADTTGIPQSQISRLERALAPSMDVERLTWIADALNPDFPLGFCPHDHACPWLRTSPPTPPADPHLIRQADWQSVERLLALVDDPADKQYEDGPEERLPGLS